MPGQRRAKKIILSHIKSLLNPENCFDKIRYKIVQSNLPRSSVLYRHQPAKGEDIQPAAKARPRPEGAQDCQEDRQDKGLEHAQPRDSGDYI